jgi:hypothetical protein
MNEPIPKETVVFASLRARSPGFVAKRKQGLELGKVLEIAVACCVSLRGDTEPGYREP